jgi:DNA-binding NarL/FixJ family response regulator
VLGLIASGKSSRQIADHLGIAFRTVVCHRYRLQTKLKVHNTADLMRAALRMRLIDL